VIAVDSRCVNCTNNPSSSDRQLILQQFKMACLQYKPTPIQFKDKIYGRTEILDLKMEMISHLD
jgi:hypothetical protein